MKNYSCKMKDCDWESVPAHTAQDAAVIYAEKYDLEDGDKVTVRGVKTFRIHTEELIEYFVE